ncbi:hypothetical protein ACFQZ4_29685 [Catellatospora coxensis]
MRARTDHAYGFHRCGRERPGGVPRVSPCRHCSRPVLRDNDGRWIHADLSYVCRDLWGGLAETTAEPAAAPRV